MIYTFDLLHFFTAKFCLLFPVNSPEDIIHLQKSLHSISLDQAELKGRMINLSQERYVNGLLTQLTELAFQSNSVENIEDEVAR